MNTTLRPQLMGLMAGLFLAAGLVISAMLVTRAWLQIAESQTIVVTGSARKDVKSDLAIWRGQFAAEARSLTEAQQVLKASAIKVETFLGSRGVTNFSMGSISIQELRGTERITSETSMQKIVGYRLTQPVTVRSEQVERITQLDLESVVLVEQGVTFTSNPPDYIYTRAGEAKVEMLAEATKDARARAEQIATQGQRKLGGLRSAKMGVFQITPVFSTETSWAGVSDTTSYEKTITSVVSATFSLN